MVGAEVALCTGLVFLAGLLVSSMLNLLHVDKGFHEERATAIDINLPDTQYTNATSRVRFYERALAEVRALPGIRSAALIQGLPLTGETMVNGIELEGSKGDWIDATSKTPILVNVRDISPGYFQTTLGIPLVKGRLLEARDRKAKVAVLSENWRQSFGADRTLWARNSRPDQE